MTLLIESMKGLGDNIFQRPFVRAAATREPVYITTPWPEMYTDLPGVHFVRQPTTLRTQAKNIARQPAARWEPPPRQATAVRFRYTPADLARQSIIASLERTLPLQGAPFVFDLPPSTSRHVGAKPYAIVRPVTVRKEWASASRGPKHQYLQSAINLLLARGLEVVTIADVDGVNETFDGPPPRGQTRSFHAGQLGLLDLIHMVRNARVIVAGVGFIVPMTIAAGVPLYIVFGGRGGHNAPHVITDPRMDMSRVGTAIPDRFCMCTDARHACDKRITGFSEKFNAWLEGALS